MAVAGCLCTGKLGNTGIPGGIKPFGITSGIVMVPIRAKDGTRNGLDRTSATLGQDWLDLLNNPDPSKRGYPYLDLKNVVHEETDPNFEEDDKGERKKTRDGIKRITYEKWEVNEQFFDKTSAACVEFGIYEIDDCGNIKGQLEGDNLFPRPANKGSFDAKFINATADLGSKVMFTVDYKFITNDGNQWMLLQSDFISVVDPLEGLGMIDVQFTTIVVDSATEITVQCDFQYGPANALFPFTGAIAADFSLLNITTPAVIVVATAVESLTVPGEYAITFLAQTTNDVVELDEFKAATGNLVNGFEGIEDTFVAL
jgi:hypothetical protein